MYNKIDKRIKKTLNNNYKDDKDLRKSMQIIANIQKLE